MFFSKQCLLTGNYPWCVYVNKKCVWPPPQKHCLIETSWRACHANDKRWTTIIINSVATLKFMTNIDLQTTSRIVLKANYAGYPAVSLHWMDLRYSVHWWIWAPVWQQNCKEATVINFKSCSFFRGNVENHTFKYTHTHTHTHAHTIFLIMSLVALANLLTLSFHGDTRTYVQLIYPERGHWKVCRQFSCYYHGRDTFISGQVERTMIANFFVCFFSFLPFFFPCSLQG